MQQVMQFAAGTVLCFEQTRAKLRAKHRGQRTRATA